MTHPPPPQSFSSSFIPMMIYTRFMPTCSHVRCNADKSIPGDNLSFPSTSSSHVFVVLKPPPPPPANPNEYGDPFRSRDQDSRPRDKRTRQDKSGLGSVVDGEEMESCTSTVCLCGFHYAMRVVIGLSDCDEYCTLPEHQHPIPMLVREQFQSVSCSSSSKPALVVIHILLLLLLPI